jgi:hypothetical protein
VVGLDALPLDLTRPGQLFFQPFDLHLQAADLLVEFLLVRGLLGTPLPPIGEQLGHLGHKLLLPGRHLARVDAELARQLGRCPVTLGGSQSHLGLERGPIHSSLPSHHPAPDRVPPTRETPPYQGARNPGSISHHASSRSDSRDGALAEDGQRLPGVKMILN